MEVPNPIAIKPKPKKTILLIHRLGSIRLLNKKSHISIPMPAINAVTNPNISGLCLDKHELHPINMNASNTSQLPTVRPTLLDRPTKSASKGDVPRSECIVSETPRVNMKIPQLKMEITRNIFVLAHSILDCFICKKRHNELTTMISIYKIYFVVNTTKI